MQVPGTLQELAPELKKMQTLTMEHESCGLDGCPDVLHNLEAGAGIGQAPSARETIRPGTPGSSPPSVLSRPEATTFPGEVTLLMRDPHPSSGGPTTQEPQHTANVGAGPQLDSAHPGILRAQSPGRQGTGPGDCIRTNYRPLSRFHRFVSLLPPFPPDCQW